MAERTPTRHGAPPSRRRREEEQQAEGRPMRMQPGDNFFGSDFGEGLGSEEEEEEAPAKKGKK